MSKIIKFKSNTDNVIEFLDELKEETIKNNISNLVIAGKTRDGEIITGFTKNLNFTESQELISNLQSSLMMRMIDYRLFGE